MSDQKSNDELLYDHVGQIVHTAVLQGIIVGSRESGSEIIRQSADDISDKATKEILNHLRIRVQYVRDEEARLRMNDPFS